MALITVQPVNATRSPVTRIGRFYITRELGRGSIGIVYLGHDPIIDRDVAIKTFSAGLSSVKKKQYEQQLINEARAAGRLSHLNIVTIYEASSEGSTTYIAMEYLQGRELSKILDKGHRFDSDEVASIVWKIADALEYAHKNDVVHRDIKPANIFIVNDNQPKIVDFGIARAPNRVADPLAHSDEPYTLFHNNVLGTPNYMSPEQATGRTADIRTDVYSLGAVMYEMLARRKPFHASSPDQLLQLIAYKAPPAPHELDSQIPIELSQIVMKAMSKRPEKRHQTANEMAVEIKRYLTRERRARQRLQKSIFTPERRAFPLSPSDNHHKLILAVCSVLTGTLAIAAYLLWLH